MSNPAVSAGLLLFRKREIGLEFFLVHPGGPFFARKNEGFWTVPKGLMEPGEDLLSTAQREFKEETGFTATPPFYELGAVRQKSGKLTHVWAFEGDCDPSRLVSNTCEIVWPPNSGRRLVIPEIDRGDWFHAEQARALIRAEQRALLDRLADTLALHASLHRSKQY